ncbi:MAG: hypothetical protein U9R19_01660, partial [Bacteroidota bacterium]|nr:hypothetical protein [Bacteroidota bacterium]
MKIFKFSTLFLFGLLLITGCGKPSDPESLATQESAGYKIVSQLSSTGYSQDVVVRDTLAYIAQGEGGLVIINIADKENPKIVSTTKEGVRGYSSKIALKDNAVYLAAGSFGINVLNVGNPDLPLITASNLAVKPAKDFHIMGNYLFTTISEQGFGVCDISFATQPIVRAETKTMGFARGITTSADSNYVFVACGEMGLSIYNISNFQIGWGIYPPVGWGDTPGYAEAVTVLDDESLAFMACGTEGLQIVDYSDSTNIHVVGSYDGGGYAKELLYENGLIYLTAELRGMQIINVSDPANPYLLG